MKKRLLSVLLLVCMVLTLLPTAAFAEDVQAEHTHCFCGGSVNAGDHTSHKDVTYKAYTKANNLRQIFYIEKVNVAYAYLADDMTLDYHFYIQEGKTLYLCLNGHTLNLDKYNILVYNRGGTLYLCDCSADKTGTISGGSNRCISVDDAAESTSTFNMYGGTLRNGKSSNGAGVEVANGTMNMYGGTITENTATRDGGGIYVGTKGTLNLYGGTITNNTVTTNEGNHGGGVYVESNFQTGAGKISISGSPVITGNTRVYTDATTGEKTTSTENLYLSYGFYNSGQFPTITLGTLTSGADIGIWAGESVFSTASDTDYSGYFSSDVAGYHVEYNEDKKLELKPGAAHVHSGGTAYCNKKALCTECGNAYGEYDPNNHSGTLGEWQSNDDNHWKEYSCCHAHAEEGTHTGGTATCTAEAVCATCGKKYGALAAHDFTAEVAEARYLTSAATCENAAVYYKSCSTCGLSSAGTADEATFTSGNPLGHDWGEPSYTWTEVADGYMCSATKVCQRCSTDVAEIATVTYAVTKEPTCLNTGTGTYTAAFSAVAYGFPAQTKDVTLSATGHSWGEPEYIWTETEDGYDCTAKRVCKNDDTHVEAETVTADYSVKEAPTCLEPGLGKAVVTFAADWATAGSTKEVTLAALGHAFGNWTSNGNGTHTRVCANDHTHRDR